MKNKALRPIIILVLCIILAITAGTIIYKQGFVGKNQPASEDNQRVEKASETQGPKDLAEETPGSDLKTIKDTPSVVESATPEATVEPESTKEPGVSIAPVETEGMQTILPTEVPVVSTTDQTNKTSASKTATATRKPTKSPAQAVTAKPVTAKPATMTPTAKVTKKPTRKPTQTPTTVPAKSPSATVPEKTSTPSASTITLTVDASVIGNGTYIKNAKVEVKQGESVAAVITRGLTQEGFGYTSQGSVDSMFYLQAITKANLVRNPVVPQRVLSILEEQDVKLRINSYKSDSLGEFDFTKYSGWRYSVNGTYANVGMSEYDLKVGDHVLLKYTLCLGYDA
ncbi:MAG: DUF4430 domain-containing protein [bacterium]|nr:DUF4430 domain-containing protein [bacterium]